jgi:hypothetical protein
LTNITHIKDPTATKAELQLQRFTKIMHITHIKGPTATTAELQMQNFTNITHIEGPIATKCQQSFHEVEKENVMYTTSKHFETE